MTAQDKNRAEFEAWCKAVNPSYRNDDDGLSNRRDWNTWQAARALTATTGATAGIPITYLPLTGVQGIAPVGPGTSTAQPVAVPAMPEPLCYLRAVTALHPDRAWQLWEKDENSFPVYTAAQVQAMLAQGLAPGWQAVPVEPNNQLLAAAKAVYALRELDSADVPCEENWPVEFAALSQAIAAAQRKPAQPVVSDAEFLSQRLARVARLAGVSMPDMTHEAIAAAAGTILGQIGYKLGADPKTDTARTLLQEALTAFDTQNAAHQPHLWIERVRAALKGGA